MWYLKSAFDTYEKVQDAVQNRLSDVQSAILSPVETMKRFLGGTAPSAPQASDSAELDALRKRVAELESRLGKSTRTKRRSRVKR